MDKKLIENKLDKLYKKVKPIFGKLELNKYSKSHFIGYNYKHAPRGKSHHWLSFGIIHDEDPEFWLNIGALKSKEDFFPIKKNLIAIQKKHKGAQINEKNGQYLLRISSPIKSTEEKKIDKALDEFVILFKNCFSQFNGIGLLGVDTFSVQTEQKIQKVKKSPKSIANKKPSNEESEFADLKRQLANCKIQLKGVNENYAEMRQSFQQTLELISKESTSLAKKHENGGVKGIKIIDIKKAIQDIKKKSSVARERDEVYNWLCKYLEKKDEVFAMLMMTHEMNEDQSHIELEFIEEALDRIVKKAVSVKEFAPVKKKVEPVKRKKKFRIKVSLSINEKNRLFGGKNEWTQPTIGEFIFIGFKKPTKNHITACLRQFLASGNSSEWPTDEFEGYPYFGIAPNLYDIPNSPLRINILSIE